MRNRVNNCELQYNSDVHECSLFINKYKDSANLIKGKEMLRDGVFLQITGI
jgi:hypothetical protein